VNTKPKKRKVGLLEKKKEKKKGAGIFSRFLLKLLAKYSILFSWQDHREHRLKTEGQFYCHLLLLDISGLIIYIP